jgi:hypothetical protein
VQSSLPAYRFATVPDVEQASRVARAVRRRWGLGDDEPVDVAARLVSLGWVVQLQDLDAAVGGLQAAMAPSADGFVFIADTRPDPAERPRADSGERTRNRVNYRLAHELGHVFFYDQATPARRLARRSEQEEAFCDAFAVDLVGIASGRSEHCFV